MPDAVWVVDDDRAIRFVLTEALRDAGYAVRAFEDADTLLAALARDQPKAVFTDVRMPGLPGLQLLERLHAQQPELPVIVMSAFTDVAATAAAYRLGAFDYLPKPFDLDELEARIRALARRGEAAPRAAAAADSFAGLSVDAGSGAVWLDGAPLELAPREAAMLRALLARPGQALAKERLVEVVFPGEDVQPDAIEVVAYRLRKRLAATAVQLVTLRGLGYLLKAQAQ